MHQGVWHVPVNQCPGHFLCPASLLLDSSHLSLLSFFYTIFKNLYCICYNVAPILGFWLRDIKDLNSLTSGQTHIPELEGKILTTGPPGRSTCFLKYVCFSMWWLRLEDWKMRSSDPHPCMKLSL